MSRGPGCGGQRDSGTTLGLTPHMGLVLLPQSSDMPLDELLALYGYEASDPISEQESEGGDTAPTLPDMTLDKVSGSVPDGATGCCWLP